MFACLQQLQWDGCVGGLVAAQVDVVPHLRPGTQKQFKGLTVGCTAQQCANGIPSPAVPSPTCLAGQVLRLDGRILSLAVHLALLQHVRHCSGKEAMQAWATSGQQALATPRPPCKVSRPPVHPKCDSRPAPALFALQPMEMPRSSSSTHRRSKPCRWCCQTVTPPGTQGPTAACGHTRAVCTDAVSKGAWVARNASPQASASSATKTVRQAHCIQQRSLGTMRSRPQPCPHRVPRPKEREQAHWLSQPRVCSNWCRAASGRAGGRRDSW